MCLFCDIVEGKIPSTKVYENDYVLCFNDINPAAPVHVLVVPKKHFDDIRDMASSAEGKEYLVAYNQDGDLKINLVKSPERQNEDAALYVAEDERDECIDARLRKVILSILSDIKFSLKASGTTYLVDGVIMALSLKNEAHRLGMTKEIYPYIADIYGVSVNSVERNIRMAIETAWSRMSYDYATKHYPYEYTSSLGRPTNQEFLFAIAGVIRRSYPEYAAWCRRMANRM